MEFRTAPRCQRVENDATRNDAGIDSTAERVYPIHDDLSSHRAVGVRLRSLAHPRWRFVFQPTSATCLNLCGQWWYVLRSLALNGRRFATWHRMSETVQQATTSRNAHSILVSWQLQPDGTTHEGPGSPACRLRPEVAGWTYRR